MAKKKLKRTGGARASAGRVNGERLLDELVCAIRQHVVLERSAAEAVALWALYTHAFDAFTISPRLGITSIVKRCGKTTLLDVLSDLVRDPLLTSNTTAAAIYLQIDAQSPTLLIDEADTFLVGNDELRGILNSGHRKKTATILRRDQQFSTWAPVAIAMIGNLPTTLEDRCIPVRLQRRRENEVVTPYRCDRSDALDQLAGKSSRWAEENLERLTSEDPEMPNALQDRAADNWRPLLAIADVAGGRWPELARAVAISLLKRTVEQEPAVMLLEDIYTITKGSQDHLSSAQLAADLAKLDNRPWAEFKGAQPITAKKIANLLASFDIAPVEMRRGMKVLRGYRIGQFEDAFARYVSASRSQPGKPAKPSRPRNSGKTVTRTVAV